MKSYASTVLGWHRGWKVDKAATGQPIRVGDRRKVTTTWDFSLSSTPGTMNVSYDLWLHDKSTADWQDQPTDEIMIWLNRPGGAGPLGTKYGSVSLGGSMWDLYRGDIGWNVHSFVRRTNTTRATLNLDDGRFHPGTRPAQAPRQRQVRLRHRVRHRGLQVHGTS